MSEFEELKEKYPYLKDRLGRTEKRKIIAEQILSVKDNKGIQVLQDELKNIVQITNEKLLSNIEMTENERNILLTDRSRCMWLADMFGIQEQVLQNTNNYLKTLWKN